MFESIVSVLLLIGFHSLGGHGFTKCTVMLLLQQKAVMQFITFKPGPVSFKWELRKRKTVENVLFGTLAVCVICYEVSSPSGVFW